MAEWHAELLDKRDDRAVEVFLERVGNPLIHYSPAYRDFLLLALPGSEALCLAVRDDGDIVGLLPGLVRRDPALGSIYNSLPFFGSHGGMLVSPHCADPDGVARALLDAVLAWTEGFASVTLIENPFAPMDQGPLVARGFSAVDDRIGQFTALPTGAEDVEAALFKKFHQKTRNAVRKGARLSLAVEQRVDREAMEWLQRIHHQSISAMGGVGKPMAIFDALTDTLGLGECVRLYVGSHDGAPVCGVLVLLYGKTVEYFTPVVEEAYKDQQALSELIYRVMAELTREGYAIWNWGGTWRSQDGVYRFKNRWGAEDKVYRYFSRAEATFVSRGAAAVAQAFPFFYLFKY